MVKADHVFVKEEHLIVAGIKKDALRLTNQKAARKNPFNER